MKLEFWGAARTVTGSMHLVQIGGRRILLDCGLYQGRRKEAFERNRSLPFDAAEIDVVLLSHAHIDHSGNLPSLLKAGFRGCVYATSATRDLCAYMLLDSAHIQENDVRYVNRHRSRRGKKPFEPLYTKEDAVEILKQFHCVDYDHPFQPMPGVKAMFRDAGHILGSASIVLEVDEGARRSRLVFSGDIGRKGLPILRDPQIPEGADYIIMESTYGNRHHEAEANPEQVLRESVRTIAQTGGKLLIPAFAVGRTQEIVYRLNQLWNENGLPRVDVFVDSPLAVNVTGVFRLHPECYDREYARAVLDEEDRDPLGFKCLQYVRSVEESKRLNDYKKAAVIIAASGMCEGGRILHHLKNHAVHEQSIVLFVSFQAEHTLGRKILDGKNPVSIYGDEYELRAQIRKAEGYSAHADRGGLLHWAARTLDAGNVKRVFLVHGDVESAEALADGLRQQGSPEVEIPERGASYEL